MEAIFILVALILASGKGTRLRPLSTEETPKQYLKVLSGKTLIEDTIDRVKDLFSYDDIFVITNINQKRLVLENLSFLNSENIIYEPEMKETLASITHAMAYVNKLRGDDVTYLILPSDHFIEPKTEFIETIKKGQALLSKHPNQFLLYGIKPTEPSPEFGYIKTVTKDNLHYVETFVEKPPLEKAKLIYSEPNYFWNNFIMLLKAPLVFKALKDIIPNQYLLVKRFLNDEITTTDFFNLTTVDNFSRAILEKQQNMLLVPTTYTWFDIGSFDSLFKVLEHLGKDKEITEIKELLNDKAAL